MQESQAFLAGRYADHLDEAGLDVPKWAWTNLLAHGTEEDLRLVETSGSSKGLATYPRWRAARSYLAREILDQLRDGVGLAELQREALIPFELHLAARPDINEGLVPQDWVLAVLGALHTYVSSRKQ